MEPNIIPPKRHTPLLDGTLKNVFFPPERGEYKYFARAAEQPFSKGEPNVKAAWAADAAMLCYARYGLRRMTDAEFEDNLSPGGLTLRAKIGEDPNDWNAPGTQAFFAEGDNFAVLAFRGTEIDDPEDSRTDLRILLLPERDYTRCSGSVASHLLLMEHPLTAYCLVHSGFQSALNRVWDQVAGYVAEYRRRQPTAEICLTGHSLGGALALLTYSRFADPNLSVYTFGCPRVGSTAFARRVARNAGKGHYRVVNFNDAVTHIPLDSALYKHAPDQCYRFDDACQLDCENDGAFEGDLSALRAILEGLPKDFQGNMQLFERPAPPSVVDHSPARYCMRLWDCV